MSGENKSNAGFDFHSIGLPPILLKWEVLTFLVGLGLSATRPFPAIFVLVLPALVVGLSAYAQVPFLEQISPWRFLIGACSLVIAGLTLLSPVSIKKLVVIVASFLLGGACGFISAPYWSETPTILGTMSTSTLAILIPFTLGTILSRIFDGAIFTIMTRVIGSWLAAAGIMLAALALSPT